MPFEGTEKKFEILVSPEVESLRNRGSAFWADVVRAANADILSRISSKACDAYLLSESSLFVFDERVIMITCGTTNLAASLELLLQDIAPDAIRSLIYERKNENFPELQPSRFEEDVAVLTGYLPGTALRFGDPGGHHLSLFHLDRDFAPDDTDITLELLMYDLDPGVRDRFLSHSTRGREDLLAVLNGEFPGFLYDDHHFDPVGYSVNGVRGEHYYTVHVTPEEPGSYTSVETNCPLSSEAIRGLTSSLVSCFLPGRFDVVLFQKEASLDSTSALYRAGHSEQRTLGCGYRVQFSHFERLPQVADLP